MITLEHDRLVFRFPEVHEDAVCRIDFQRTLRIPDDGKDYPLPPGLGSFPLRHLDDHASRVPESWRKRGGVMLPMYQAEAMWLHFGANGWRHGDGYPFAVKIGTGKINAVTGEGWSNHLNRDPQDYLVVPKQPWLDGYCVEKGVIRQFVAMPLGDGSSVEEQLTGEAEWGGVQIAVYPMKAERYEALVKARRGFGDVHCVRFSLAREPAMGLSAGGRMKQEVYEDQYELTDYDQRHGSRCFVTILNSAAWLAATGERPPAQPPSAKDYTKAGLPWFDYYAADAKALGGAGILGKVKSLAQLTKFGGKAPADVDESIAVENVMTLGASPTAQVREAEL